MEYVQEDEDPTQDLEEGEIQQVCSLLVSILFLKILVTTYS